MSPAVTIGHDHGHAVTCHARAGSGHAARLKIGVLGDDLSLSEIMFVLEVDKHSTLWKKTTRKLGLIKTSQTLNRT